MNLKGRVWAFMHPDLTVRLSDLEWFIRDIRELLTESNANLRNPHLTGELRRQQIDRNQTMLNRLAAVFK